MPASCPDDAAPPSPQFMLEPLEVIVDIVASFEPSLDRQVVADTVRSLTSHLGDRRRLARALHDDTGLLTSGRPEGPPSIAKLVRALRVAGAVQLIHPRCADCGRERLLPQRNAKGKRQCESCHTLARQAGMPHEHCTGCGKFRRAQFRGRRGEPRCRYCPPEPSVDHTAEISEHVLRLEPTFDTNVLRVLIENAVPQPSQRRHLAWDLEARPELLTGDGVYGSSRLAALIDELVRVRTRGVEPLGCGFCGKVRRLRLHREGKLCCATCYSLASSEPCSRCAELKVVAARDPDGRALCRNCDIRQPYNSGRCSRCDRVRPLGRRHGEALCTTCNRGALAICVRCHQEKFCYRPDSDDPICFNCNRWTQAEQCINCGRARQVAFRQPDGTALCGVCGRKKEICIHCNIRKEVNGRTVDGPLCSSCYAKDPISFRNCNQCGSLERLHHFGLCSRCACPGVLLSMLTQPDGRMRPELETVMNVLLTNEPVPLLLWLSKPAPRRVFAELARGSGPITHQELDGLTSVKGSQRLREVLVNAQLLPARDEHFAHLERWLERTLPRIKNPVERKAMRSYLVWGHVRRLRKIAEQRPLTRAQATNVYAEVLRSIELLDWLEDRQHSLATANQHLIDEWLSESRKDVHGFITWAVNHGYASNIAVPRRQPGIVRIVLPKQDHRWDLARRLLHDTTIDTVDRVAGLLVLFYAQPLSRICQLTISHLRVRNKDDTATNTVSDTPPKCEVEAQLLLGTKPLDLPTPLAALVLELVENRRGHAVIGHTDDHPWLFPGGAPGQHISSARLAHRLKRLQIPPRASRNTALMGLAAEIPAKVLGDLLGISLKTAINWSEEAGNTRLTYAADVVRRPPGTRRR